MQIPVLVVPIDAPPGWYRATCGPPFSVDAYGPTEDEALKSIGEKLDQLKDGGAKVRMVDFTEGRPTARRAGIFKDNPLFDRWQEAIAEYRQSVDEADGMTVDRTEEL